MILVDTSVWISHLREGNNELISLLNKNEVLCHPFIVGEIACGNLKNRTEIIYLLNSLPSAIVAEPEEILQFIENNELMGKGLGYIDIHLLASALLTHTRLWTLDKRLDDIAKKFSRCK
ncbi:MAG: type II toxin-antitoxin system VapC family toxin [bacterium]